MRTFGFSFILFSLRTFATASYPPPCSSNIFCHGKLLHTVQMAGIFPDSKTFVDMKLKTSPEHIWSNFEQLMRKYSDSPPRNAVEHFVYDNFEEAGSEFVNWDPIDWHANPKFLNNISDPQLQQWGSQLHSYWKELGRKIKDDVRINPNLYSMIYVPNPVIVPGGRFREFYYWDSYWIIDGLLLSEMKETVKGMLENFIHMVKTLGYVPNGGRVYFQRSQPPLLIPMVKLYVDRTGDFDFALKNLETLKAEFEFWIRNRTINVKQGDNLYQLARYNVEKGEPRPESYREDYDLATQLKTQEEKDELYVNLKSAAESGWDFSSRWFIPPPGFKDELRWTKTRDVIPADLNAFIYLNAKILAEFCHKAGQSSDAAQYENYANEWQDALNNLLWDEKLGAWFDYDLSRNRLNTNFYPSNIIPLWAGAQDSPVMVAKVVEYLKQSTSLKYPGGLPTSLVHAGEQWDFPNGWAPLQHLVVDALHKSGDEEAKALAFEIAERWIENNYKAFVQSNPNHMFEKYDVTTVGLPGGGGEYSVVVGFGWTNGVVLDFLNRFGDRLQSERSSSQAPKAFSSITLLFMIVGGLTTIFSSLILGISSAKNHENCGCGVFFARICPSWCPGFYFFTLSRTHEMSLTDMNDSEQREHLIGEDCNSE